MSLSDKRRESFDGSDMDGERYSYHYPEEDVKEFIRRLKYLDQEELAKRFHEIYEYNSAKFNWKTQKSCKFKFDDLPKENKKTMIETCEEIISFLNRRIDEEAGEKLT